MTNTKRMRSQNEVRLPDLTAEAVTLLQPFSDLLAAAKESSNLCRASEAVKLGKFEDDLILSLRASVGSKRPPRARRAA